MRLRTLGLIGGILAGLFLTVQALEVPPLRQRVTDLTGTLTAREIEELELTLSNFEAQTSNQLAVLVIASLEDQAIEDYAIRVVDAWKLGKADKDNGILLLIALNDRQMRIEVGYGLEGALTDMLSSQIIRYEIAPEFRRGDYYAGIKRGVTAIMRATQNEYQGNPQDRTSYAKKSGRHLIGTLIFFLIMLLLIGGGRGKKGGGGGNLLTALLLANLFRGSGGGWRSGGFGGGGFGGFGGFSGGGGGFGGGGASGGW